MTTINEDGKATCGVYSEHKKARCQMPAGLGTDTLGTGPCYHHSQAEVIAGDDVLQTTRGHAAKLEPKSVKKMFRYEMEGDSRLAVILRGMGAVMEVDTSIRAGVATLDLGYEMKAMRAMLILFMERYQEREDALLLWADAYNKREVCTPPPRILDITQGHKAVVGIAQVAKTMHEIQGSVPRAEFMQMMVDMADVVNSEVSDKRVRSRIKRQWLEVCAKHVMA